MMQNMRRIIKGLFLVLMVSALSGCGKNIVLNAHESIYHSCVEVHLRGAQLIELEYWKNMSMTKYWSQRQGPNQKNEPDIKYYLGVKDGAKQRIQKLLTENPVWDKWRRRGVTHLLVLANLPGVYEDRLGNADSRRLYIPLDDSCWEWFSNRINITVTSENIVLESKLKCPVY